MFTSWGNKTHLPYDTIWHVSLQCSSHRTVSLSPVVPNDSVRHRKHSKHSANWPTRCLATKHGLLWLALGVLSASTASVYFIYYTYYNTQYIHYLFHYYLVIKCSAIRGRFNYRRSTFSWIVGLFCNQMHSPSYEQNYHITLTLMSIGKVELILQIVVTMIKTTKQTFLYYKSNVWVRHYFCNIPNPD